MKIKTRILSVNMRGEDVRLLQENLKRLGLVINDREGFFGKTTRQAVIELQKKHGLKATGIVDVKTASLIDEEQAINMESNLGIDQTAEEKMHKVFGTIRDQYQQPMSRIQVRAFDKAIRSEQLLGEAVSDLSGKYDINYLPKQLSVTGKESANVMVRIYDNKDTILSESDVHYNAPASMRIDFDLSGKPYRGLSEYEQLAAMVKPFIGDLQLAMLKEDEAVKDITFLANKTNSPRDRIEALAMASRFEVLTKIPAVVYYGLLRGNVPGGPIQNVWRNISAPTFEQQATAKLDDILQENIDVLIQTLHKGMDDNIIPYAIAAEVTKIKDQFVHCMGQFARKHPVTGDTSPFFQKLQIGGLSLKASEQVIGLMAGYSRPFGTFFNELKNHESLAPKADKLNAVFQLSGLTADHLALTAYLSRSEKIRSADDLVKLARYDRQDWERILQEQNFQAPPGIAGESLDEKRKGFAAALEKNFTAMYPTASFTARLQKDSKSRIARRDQLIHFFNANPEFDLMQHRIGEFLSGHQQAAVPEDDSLLVDQLRRVQRVFKLAPTYTATHTLLSDGIHSSHQIYAMGKDRFARQYGDLLGKKEADLIFCKAAKTYAAAVAISGNLQGLATASTINAFPDYQTPILATSAAKEIPSLDTLFQHADFCECEECRSVYGAASYLTDLLHFLNERETDAKGSVQGSLLARRPDIGDIDLNCTNTNTELPYIDIVCEILEDVISPPVFAIPGNFIANLPAQGTVTESVIDATLCTELRSHTADIPQIDLFLTGQAKVSAPFQAKDTQACAKEKSTMRNQWILRDRFIAFKLIDTTTDDPPTISVRLLHQTHLSTEELRANSEYTNYRTYTDRIKLAQRPFGLPFDLFSTEGKIYLTKLGINKADLIRIFRQKPLPNVKTFTGEWDEACAYLDVSEQERILIFTEDQNQFTYWGALANSSTVKVDAFLQYTALEYADLQTLLSLQFINPSGDIQIIHDNLMTCDLNNKHVNNLSPPKFDHIHRFLRLWKKTTLTMQELDACIQCPAIGAGKVDAHFACQFHHFLQLKERLGLDVFPLLAFFQSIDTNGDDCLYNRLFQNKQITNPVNPDFALSNITTGNTLIHDPQHDPQGQRCSVIQTAVGISAEDLGVLLADAEITVISLENLSSIYRKGLLLQSQSWSANDLDVALQVIPFNPFGTPTDTMVFLSKTDLLNTAGISIWELNYLLRHQKDLNQTLIPADETISRNLGELQDALLQVQAYASPNPDPNGDLLEKWLNDPVLKWEPSVATKLLTMLNTTDDEVFQKNILSNNAIFLTDLRIQYCKPFHEVTLSELPAIDTLKQISPDISYETVVDVNDPSKIIKKLLKYSGTMTQKEQDNLLSAFNDQAYQDAVNQLYSESQTQTTSEAVLDALPSLTSYAPCAGQLVFDGSRKTLRFTGYMDVALCDALKSFYSEPGSVGKAIDQLFNAQTTDNSAANIFFADNEDLVNKLKDCRSPSERFAFFLEVISPIYQKIQQQTAIQNRISTWFSVDKTVSSQLLLSVPAIYNDWTESVFVRKGKELNESNYPAQYRRYRLLAKIGILVHKLRIDANALAWLVAHAEEIRVSNPLALPVAPVSSSVSVADFLAIENLINLLRLHHGYVSKKDDLTIFTVFQRMLDAAAPIHIHTPPNLPNLPIGIIPKYAMELSSLYGWDSGQLKDLMDLLNVTLEPAAKSDLRDVNVLVQLYKCFATMSLLGTSAADCVRWSHPSLTPEDSVKIKQTLKARYSDDDWLVVTQPLQDSLRERKRDALVAYLLANPQGNCTWRDANDLYSYFLIDVEMSSCMQTSRIVQATNSVQQFVKRCFLSLEDGITVNIDDVNAPNFDSKWEQWEWMKNYRGWEANRKVFLYPENWIEPELLPNKSFFFKELQNELLQNEVTKENVEDAFMHYLEKLDGVARLELKTMWYQEDNQTLHVIGRTYGGDPKLYYYRKFVNNQYWTPWEKVDLDIHSDHLVLVVFNQRTYLFWAVIDENVSKDSDDQKIKINVPSAGEQDYEVDMNKVQLPKVWHIQLAFSEYKKGKWSSKKLSNNDDTGRIIVSESEVKDKTNFLFTPIDLPRPDFSNLWQYLDKKDINVFCSAFYKDVADSLKENGTIIINCYSVDDDGVQYKNRGSFFLDPCRGYPARHSYYNINIYPPIFGRSKLQNMLDEEKGADTTNDQLAYTNTWAFMFNQTPDTWIILNQTPGLFRNLVPLQGGFADRFFYFRNNLLYSHKSDDMFLGTMMPFFYQDVPHVGKIGRTYYVAPEATDNDKLELFYPDFEDLFLRNLEPADLCGYIHVLLEVIAQCTAGGNRPVVDNVDEIDKIANRLVQDCKNYSFPKGEVKSMFIDHDTSKAMGIISRRMQNRPNEYRFLHHFYNFYHPLVCYFMRQLFGTGIDGLMSRQTQLKGDIAYDDDPAKFDFKSVYYPQESDFNGGVYTGSPVTYPNGVIDTTPGYPKEDVDFDILSGYGLYNWELFYHAPLMIAQRLSENQQFEDADRWFKYIFDPTDASNYPAPDKFWITKPFFLNVVDINNQTKYDKERIENIMWGIAQKIQDLEKRVEQWRENAFQPHYIAQYRWVAYQKAAVMKYLDHLIRWGDYLFMQQTMESVNEATQLYILAAQILGDRPKIVPPAYDVPVNNYYQLEAKTKLDSFSNALIEIENLLPLHVCLHTYRNICLSSTTMPVSPPLATLYFCIPFNDQLLSYWVTVEDRLFKIRHCLNIEGVYSPLALFAPPIDPGMLVRAAAAGLDLSSVLNDLSSPLPYYRFNVMVQKATELCNEVKALGAALLSALEKKDAEHLALLRSSHEISLLNAVMAVKQKQIEEAMAQGENLMKQKELINIRITYYQKLIDEGWTVHEQMASGLRATSTLMDAGIAAAYIGAGGLRLLPDFVFGGSGFGGSPTSNVGTGGKPAGASAENAAKTISTIATGLDKSAAVIDTTGDKDRRAEEWQHQLNLANKELEQIGQQIIAAKCRLDMANTDKDNQQLQIDNAREDNDFMHSKFTNEDLYSWMIGQIATTYFQSYQLAYDVAKRAERCFRFELGLADSNYIQFGYWDSMKKGLLSGEQLIADIKRMEMDYLNQNKREYELTKHISLATLDPIALLRLKQTGQCFINLPEELFDMDYPGHYFRRIKSASLTIPCVTGPYTTLGCTLTLMKNSIRIVGTNVADAKLYPRRTAKNGVPADDPRFRDSQGVSQSIVLSHGQNDNGMFELNYRDERYLPFEGAGAISLWHLQFPFANTNQSGKGSNPLLQQFDYQTISDVVLHLRYTAREGGDALKANASDNLINKINTMLVSMQDTGLMRLFSLKHEFPSEWYAFFNPPSDGGDQVLSVIIDSDRFPYFASLAKIEVTKVEIFADASWTSNPTLSLSPPKETRITMSSDDPTFGKLYHGSTGICNITIQDPTATTQARTWQIVSPSNTNVEFTNENLKDLLILLHYKVTPKTGGSN
jgi:peptidoglycan hydrolase-like protein with peptidoglycan-binding domain